MNLSVVGVFYALCLAHSHKVEECLVDAPVPADATDDGSSSETEGSTGDEDGANSGTVEESPADDTDDGSSSETEVSTGDEDGANSGTVEESPADDTDDGSSSETEVSTGDEDGANSG